MLGLEADLVGELDAGILDHFCPLGRFFLDDRGELSRRVADRLKAKITVTVHLIAHEAAIRHHANQGPGG